MIFIDTTATPLFRSTLAISPTLAPATVMERSVTLSFSLATLWYERQRFLPGVLAVAFSALLIAFLFRPQGLFGRVAIRKV